MNAVIAKRDGYVVGRAAPCVVPRGGALSASATLASAFDPSASATVHVGTYGGRDEAEDAAQLAAEQLAAVYSGTSAPPDVVAAAWEAINRA